MTPHLTLSKKILSILLSILLVVAFVPAVAFAGNDANNEVATFDETVVDRPVYDTDDSFGGVDDSDFGGVDSSGDTEGSGGGTEITTWPDPSGSDNGTTENNQGTQEGKELKENSWRYTNGELTVSDESEDAGIEAYSIRSNSNKRPVAHGIDVSEHNGTINWDAVKNSGQVDFAILRVGYGDDYSYQDDKQWARNVSECERLGIPYGVYIYSYATSWSQLNSEVSHVKRLLKGHNPSYPVYIDMEDDSTIGLGRNTLTQFAKSFCDQINSAGYTAGVYANLNWWNNYLYASQLDNYERWVAQYNSSCWYEGDYSLWQHSSSGSVPGISGNVDMNYEYGIGFGDASNARVKYCAHIQNLGWLRYKGDGATSGTTGQELRMEAIRIKLGNEITSQYQGSIQYRSHIQDIGWENEWSSDGEMSGTSNRSLRLEAIQIRLTDDLSKNYDVYYRVHSQKFGWLGWAKNGESAGTEGYSYRLEAIEIQLVPKGGSAPGSTENAFRGAKVRYETHIQNKGWQETVNDGATSGTTGQELRMEAIRIKLGNEITSQYQGSIQYRSHIQDIGWENEWSSDGEMSGTSNRSLRLEAIQIRLTDDLSKNYDVYYRVHSQKFGWLGWAKNGESAGTEGYSYRLEAIEIQLVPKGGSAPGSTENAFYIY